MNIRFGDVVLFSNEDDKKGKNKLSQSIIRKAQAEYSHVALCLSDNLVIHAIPDKGVELKTFKELVDEYKVYKAIRHVVLGAKANDVELATSLMNDVCYNLDRPYGLKSLMDTDRSDGSIICSNLVATCLLEHDITIGKSSSNVLPYDFQILCESGDWIDVTKEHFELYEMVGYCNYAHNFIQIKLNHRMNDIHLTEAYERLFDEKNIFLEVDELTGTKLSKLAKPKGLSVYWDTIKKKFGKD